VLSEEGANGYGGTTRALNRPRSSPGRSPGHAVA
jgi:hypothetical protein